MSDPSSPSRDPDSPRDDAGMQAVERALDRGAAVEREAVLDEAQSARLDGGDAAVRKFFEQHQPRRRWRPAAVAGGLVGLAALVVVAISLVGRDPGPAVPPGIPMDGFGALGGLHPDGSGTDWTTFAWQATLPPGGAFEVLVFFDGWEDGVFDWNDAEADRVIRDWKEPRWAPKASDLQGWPPEILWMVRVYDATDEVVAERVASASRSSAR